MCFQARSSCFPAKRSFQICSHVLFELQLGSFLSATCHGLQHSISFCSCCFTVHIWSWLWASAVQCPHHLLVGSAGKWGPPSCHARSGVTQETHKDVVLCYVMLCQCYERCFSHQCQGRDTMLLVPQGKVIVICEYSGNKGFIVLQNVLIRCMNAQQAPLIISFVSLYISFLTFFPLPDSSSLPLLPHCFSFTAMISNFWDLQYVCLSSSL